MSATKPLLPSYFDAENLVIGAKNTQKKDYSLDGEDVTVTTDKVTGGLCILNEVDEDSLNPVTGKAVAKAIAEGGGGVPDVTNPLYIDTDDAVALRYGSGLTLEEGAATEDDTLAVAVSGTGGLYYDELENNALAVQLDPDGGIENYLDDGEQVGLRVKVDGTSIDINADGELEAIGGGSSERFMAIINQTSFSDIWNAYIAGKDVWATNPGQTPDDPTITDARIYRLNYIWHPYQNSGIASFTSLEDNGGLFSECWSVDANNNWIQNTYAGVLAPSTSSLLPSYDSSTDEGKILKIVSGVPTWVTP